MSESVTVTLVIHTVYIVLCVLVHIFTFIAAMMTLDDCRMLMIRFDAFLQNASSLSAFGWYNSDMSNPALKAGNDWPMETDCY